MTYARAIADGARAEARNIAERGSIRLHIADIHFTAPASSSARNRTRGNPRRTNSLTFSARIW
jgi:hypothetical protein